MKRLFILSVFVLANLLMASCTQDGFSGTDGVTTNTQADGDTGGPGHLPIKPPPPPPPPGNGINP
ncbi:MAG: hypothetical protein PSV16_06115 [Flavobacterium sp.]|nr:hypothetical protein [Flavobacterium sp.]